MTAEQPKLPDDPVIWRAMVYEMRLTDEGIARRYGVSPQYVGRKRRQILGRDGKDRLDLSDYFPWTIPAHLWSHHLIHMQADAARKHLGRAAVRPGPLRKFLREMADAEVNGVRIGQAVIVARRDRATNVITGFGLEPWRQGDPEPPYYCRPDS